MAIDSMIIEVLIFISMFIGIIGIISSITIITDGNNRTTIGGFLGLIICSFYAALGAHLLGFI